VDGEIFLSTRHDAITADSFRLALEPEELTSAQQDVQRVGYLAIDAGTGTWNGSPFQAATTTESFTRFFRRVSFGQKYPSVPSVLASLASYNETDNSHLRFQNLDLDSIDLKIEEETTADDEVQHHTRESVAYLAIGSQGPLNGVTTSIPDGLTQSFQLEVSDTGRVGDLDVKLELVHNLIEDLDIFLEAPDGTIVELLTDVAVPGDTFLATRLDNEAGSSISSGKAPFDGPFQPEGMLRNFTGKSISGTWTLHVTDDTVNGNRGALLGWSLDIELASEPPGNVNFDSHVDATDIDVLFANLGSRDPTLDLDGDGDVDRADVDYLITAILHSVYGDTNLDGDVDMGDLAISLLNFTGAGGIGKSFSQGDNDGDGDIDTRDITTSIINFSGTCDNCSATLHADSNNQDDRSRPTA